MASRCRLSHAFCDVFSLVIGDDKHSIRSRHTHTLDGIFSAQLQAFLKRQTVEIQFFPCGQYIVCTTIFRHCFSPKEGIQVR